VLSAIWDDPPHLRGELLTADHLAEHAAAVARAHGPPSKAVAPGRLWQRFKNERERIREVYATLSREAPTKRETSPAEEWLLDNSHVVEDQLREIQEDLPAGYLRELPRAARGVMAGYPLVYGLCIDYLRHTDARLDLDSLARFVRGYQSVRTLTIGELWAVPIMLRLGLVLTVGALAGSEVESNDRAHADEWADKLLSPQHPHMKATLDRLDKRTELHTPAFLVRLLRRLREHDAPSAPAVEWVRAQCQKLGLTIEELTRRQHLKQAADQVSVGNSITSMRAIGVLEWNRFFEDTSLVESILRRDPAQAYTDTEKKSRDRYRHAVEDLARRSPSSEQQVAERALALAEARAQRPDPDDRAHVGFYLVGEGREALERELGYRPKWGRWLREGARRHASLFYFGALSLTELGFVALVLAAARATGQVPGPWVLAALGLTLLPASEFSVTLINALVTPLVPPHQLAKLELPKGIPPEYRTLVVVPALLDSEGTVAELLAHLEIRALANPGENLHFALLTDFVDHSAEEHPDDDRLLALAREGIDTLNRRHAPGGERFLLLHRRRVHNPTQGVWMGWERKRGKLEELNRVLRGATDTTYSVITGSPALLESVRFVITLDADTELPRDVAQKLVATLAHPLNRPRFDPTGHQVVRGYGVIQPRVGTDPVSARRTHLSRLMAGEPGLDPYTTAISDVYQDLFGEGSYVGKAIYDVDAFTAALEGRVPENTLLSHDLFEGIHARTALATDIELLDDQPATYHVQASRQHRWIRGDWQLLPWVFSPLSLLARWKLVDNLRRSLLAPAMLVALAVGWLVSPALGLVASLAALIVLFLPLLSHLGLALARPAPHAAASRFDAVVRDFPLHAAQRLVSITLLLDQAVISLDAVVRTLHRLFVSRRSLLEWQTMQAAQRSAARGQSPTARRLRRETAGVVLSAAGLAALQPGSLPFAAPFLALWGLAPWLADWLGKPLPARQRGAELSLADRQELRLIARKTWHFFETFVTAADHFLPPDNFQEEPRGVVAHRTSPTNIGLYLMSTVTARDLGYVTLADMSQRLAETLTTIEGLEKREGHILNWYDTSTARPLEPRYVSTVDSGNLAAYLWTVAMACREMRHGRLLSSQIFAAAIDACALSASEDPEPDIHAAEALRREIDAHTGALDGTWSTALAALRAAGRAVVGPVTEEITWEQSAARGLAAAVAEVAALVPWVDVLGQLPASATSGEGGEALGKLAAELDAATSLEGLVAATERAREVLLSLTAGAALEGLRERLDVALAASHTAAQARLDQLAEIERRSLALGDGMQFGFLYDAERNLFSIGYNVSSARLDGSHYDLLASEARLASLLAIAKGDVPQEHWFRLGRPRAAPAGEPVLLSWSGSMFEYLMPLLVTKTHERTLLDETYDGVVTGQRLYARSRDIPWGISESAYNIMDLSMTYQYHAFGVPGFGLKAGLEDDLVVAPYATVLAALVRPDLALENLRVLASQGLEGAFGFYEAIDFSPSHAPPGRRGVVVKAYMAHHQGMSLVALGHVLCGAPMQRRFHSERRIQATELLLEERVPVAAPLAPLRETPASPPAPEVEADVVEHVGLMAPGPLRAHLLGHGELSTIVTAHGTGITRWKNLDVHRTREDALLGGHGILVYLRDLAGGEPWSAGYQPLRRTPDRYDVAFAPDCVRIHRRDGDLETVLEIGASPERPAEVRRLSVTNHGSEPRTIEVTTYAEIVLAPHDADVAHRAFSGMFLETSAMPEKSALLARRRPRSHGEAESWVIQVLAREEGEWTGSEWDTSRAAFLGRGRTVERPAALDPGSRLGGTAGAVLDPAFALRRQVVIAPGKRARLALTTALAESRDAAIELIELYGAAPSIARTFELAWADARVELRHLGLSGTQAERYQRLLSALLDPTPAFRATLEPWMIRGRTKDALWSQGISGDLPILLVRLDDPEIDDLCREVLLAQEFWRLNGVTVDLVIFNEEPAGYHQPLQDRALGLVAASPAEGKVDQRGGVFVRRAHQMSTEHRALMLASARVVLATSRGSLGRQLRAATTEQPARPALRPPVPAPVAVASAPLPALDLAFDNGLGGFADGGHEYAIRVGKTPTPAPWVNVIANPTFGCIVSEGGSMTTWSTNSQSHRLTAWSNDPISDPSGDLIYLRDDDDGAVWTATPRPAGEDAPHEIRHGQGYSLITRTRGTIEQQLAIFVDPEEPIKVCRLRLRNTGTKPRRLTACAMVEWVLGASRERGRYTVVTEVDETSGTVFAFNPFSNFPERRAFLIATAKITEHTCDREEFFGKTGTRARPECLSRVGLSGRTGAGLDPCTAIMVPQTLAPGEQVEVAFVLGEGTSLEDARRLVLLFRDPARVDQSFRAAIDTWEGLLSAVTVKTPSAALDTMVNRWLLYQAQGSRIWGRSAFYQSGGAFGYRDQLQDVLALIHTRPERTRAQILLAASRQFVEGDVQHWWHGETGEGVRTFCSDDLLWLPFVAAEYVRATGDTGILDEPVSFLEERTLKEGEHDLFTAPRSTHDTATLYEHCVRALDRGTTTGAHGLPLMGAGDWNDGLSAVGIGGQGESVWLAWFLARTMLDFAPIAAARGDTAREATCHETARRVSQAIELSSWDGAWYRRAYFDDGTPIGSHENAECRIDAIAQSWAVIAGTGDAGRAHTAVRSSLEQLVRPEQGSILLFTPAFEHSDHDPGYIQAYPAGVRENGGQYTHGVLWTVMATALLGDGERALALLDMLNPIHHADTADKARRYAVEPYVVAADVYNAPGAQGRGGWTWYTGSAAWMYRITLEHVLGIQLAGGRLVFAPCIPPSWRRYEVDYRRGTTLLHIVVDNPDGVSRGPCRVELDGRPVEGPLAFPDDGARHEVRVTLLREEARPQPSRPSSLTSAPSPG
jgi:cyclic beta-1,2-glucan synthetase